MQRERAVDVARVERARTASRSELLGVVHGARPVAKFVARSTQMPSGPASSSSSAMCSSRTAADHVGRHALERARPRATPRSPASAPRRPAGGSRAAPSRPRRRRSRPAAAGRRLVRRLLQPHRRRRRRAGSRGARARRRSGSRRSCQHARAERRERELAAGHEHAPALARGGVHVRHEEDARGADDGVERRVGQVERLHVADPHLDRQAQRLERAAGDLEHAAPRCRCRAPTPTAPARAAAATCGVARAGGDVEHPRAGRQVGHLDEALGGPPHEAQHLVGRGHDVEGGGDAARRLVGHHGDRC